MAASKRFLSSVRAELSRGLGIIVVGSLLARNRQHTPCRGLVRKTANGPKERGPRATCWRGKRFPPARVVGRASSDHEAPGPQPMLSTELASLAAFAHTQCLVRAQMPSLA